MEYNASRYGVMMVEAVRRSTYVFTTEYLVTIEHPRHAVTGITIDPNLQ